MGFFPRRRGVRENRGSYPRHVDFSRGGGDGVGFSCGGGGFGRTVDLSRGGGGWRTAGCSEETWIFPAAAEAGGPRGFRKNHGFFPRRQRRYPNPKGGSLGWEHEQRKRAGLVLGDPHYGRGSTTQPATTLKHPKSQTLP